MVLAVILSPQHLLLIVQVGVLLGEAEKINVKRGIILGQLYDLVVLVLFVSRLLTCLECRFCLDASLPLSLHIVL